jgi:uncharacterized membrane protein
MLESNPNARLETFCDGVFAIAMTLLIIDIKIPSGEAIKTSADLWQALEHLVPSVLAFLLSFVVILITWVNHHNGAKLIVRSSNSYIYANGFILLTVVFLPFPTALLGDSLFTEHAAPSVVLYVLALALQALSWVTVTSTVLKNKLEINEQAALAVRRNRMYGMSATLAYLILAAVANWFPITVMIITSVMWGFWMIHGIRLKMQE